MFSLLSIDDLSVFAFMALLVVAAYFDFSWFRIPNRLNIAIAALYPVHVMFSLQAVDWTAALGVAAVVLAFGAYLFVSGAMGGGDVKLFAVTSLWAGPAMVFQFLVLTSIVGAVMALAMVTPFRFGLAAAFESVGGLRMRDVLLSGKLPYGAAIACGGFYVGVVLVGGVL